MKLTDVGERFLIFCTKMVGDNLTIRGKQTVGAPNRHNELCGKLVILTG